ncbi:cryptochrome-1-like [Melia azedarach]|uniref:Cryptochrome-1-like n=1 Tax=Melia azedarach TaxID=155640 RepID=A0ACC1YH18_MELAZ|nr:cryptochrome-1-like [Melia azedarach]
MGSNKTIVWFRRDLRIEDNPALAAAARDGCVFPVYIWCPKEEGQFYPGRVSRWWLKQSLIHLGKSLKSLGAELALIRTQSTLAALLECISAIKATKIVFNHLYDPVSLVRDHTIKEKLVELGISVQSYNGDLLYEPWEIYDERGHAFTTFDAYWDRCLHMPMEPISLLPPWRLVQAVGTFDTCSIEDLALEDETEKSSNALLGRGWSPGWSNADKVLTEFVEQHLLHYSKNRQKLGGNSTSLLSPYLHFGELSSEESIPMAMGLREYSRYLCFNFPFTHERSLLSNLKYFPWNADLGHFKSWRQGRTGYPLVDAGMRELWATGWIHNRVRIWKCDILGWQYISGSIPDGHELERLDSPEIQGSKFDPEGEYVRQWLPELARMPTEWIHHPWDAPLTVLKAAGVELGLNYPKPIIDLDLAREQLTQAIFKMWEMEASAKGENLNETSEVVIDNSDRIQTPDIPKVVLREKPTCPTTSSNDQRVPSIQNGKMNPPCRKRPKNEEEEQYPDELHNRKTGSCLVLRQKERNCRSTSLLLSSGCGKKKLTMEQSSSKDEAMGH